MKKVFLSFLFSTGLPWGMETEQAEPCNLLNVPFEVFHTHIAPHLMWRDYEEVHLSCKHFNEQLKGEEQVVDLKSSFQNVKDCKAYLNQYPMAKGVDFSHIWDLPYPEEQSAKELLDYLKSMRNIRELTLRNFPIVDTVLQNIVNCLPSLRKLRILDSARINTKPQLSILSQLSQLKELYLGYETGFREKELAQLHLFKSLEKLTLDDPIMDRSWAEAIEQLHNLTYLKIYMPTGNYYPMIIPTPPKLRKLDMTRIQFTKQNIPTLFQLTNLEALSLFDYDGFPNEVIERLNELPSLKDLNLFGCFIHSTAMPYLGQLTNLRRLELGGCKEINGGQFTPLKNLSKIKELSLQDTKINEEDMVAITHLKNLTSLNLAHCEDLSNQAFALLGDLSNLQMLNVAHTSIDDIVIETLIPKLSFLTVLTVSPVKVIQQNRRRWGDNNVENKTSKIKGISLEKIEELKNKYPNIQITTSHY